jgi:hypothetical protein
MLFSLGYWRRHEVSHEGKQQTSEKRPVRMARYGDIVPTLEQNLKTVYGQLGNSDRERIKINDKTKSCYYYFFTLPFLFVRDKVRKCSW